VLKPNHFLFRSILKISRFESIEAFDKRLR
jgi:hypothetical protein